MNIHDPETDLYRARQRVIRAALSYAKAEYTPSFPPTQESRILVAKLHLDGTIMDFVAIKEDADISAAMTPAEVDENDPLTCEERIKRLEEWVKGFREVNGFWDGS